MKSNTIELGVVKMLMHNYSFEAIQQTYNLSEIGVLHILSKYTDDITILNKIKQFYLI